MSTESWLPHFNLLSPAYEIFSWLPPPFTKRMHWPSLEDYNSLATLPHKSILNQQNKVVTFVNQLDASLAIDMGYESKIFLTGQVPTRPFNWHDFFNMLIWYSFPNIKSQLNALQYGEITRRVNHSKQRSHLENFLTLFDENGIIITSSNQSLLQLIEDMQWKQLFWHHRDILSTQLKCFIVGHSLHEKLLNPYIGMVGHSLLLPMKESFFNKSVIKQMEDVETAISQLNLKSMTPQCLFPIPILGFPEWCQESNSPEFYENKNYFRTQRRRS